MRRVRLPAAAALAAAAVACPSPAAASPADAAPVVVRSDGAAASTPYATDATSVYRITVTGAYSYNGRQNLADCGWWNPEWAGDAWVAGSALLLDGAPAACASQPYTMTHTYTWLEQGTGAPFTFQVVDPAPYDNMGSLVVLVNEDRGEPRVEAACVPIVMRDSEIDALVVHVVLLVRTSGGYHPTYQSGRCRFSGPNGTAATVTGSGVGPVTVWTDVVLLAAADYVVCASAQAYWLVGGSAAQEERCNPV